jgi:hypothetical protein
LPPRVERDPASCARSSAGSRPARHLRDAQEERDHGASIRSDRLFGAVGGIARAVEQLSQILAGHASTNCRR